MHKDSLELPPILPNIEQELLDYLICPDRLPIHEYEASQEFWPRKPDPTSLFNYSNSPLSTKLKVQRDPNTGEIIEFREVPIQTAGNTARNSMLLTRAPASPSEATWGSILNFPFWPGGLSVMDEPDLPTEVVDTNDLLTVPPGFARGLNFEEDGCTIKSDTTNKTSLRKKSLKDGENVINLIDILDQEDDYLGIWKTIEKPTIDSVELPNKQSENLPEEDGVIPKEIPILHISDNTKEKFGQVSEWTVLLDTSKPVLDFHKRIPEMALEYEFELDTFQKLAILQLEKHNHVFVAAHTSAGKTVVAEYAIALSQKHMTKTIYTSPIKALSNQKYRDFKHKFKDVGLVTGDFQINMKASCLIMTTEILRSMLYAGSEVTRDLEYVIFDEVHYINDIERGHVWEQVLIMLPAHVCVVLLSATVPNTIEFADWLGQTYQKKVYVVTTHQRPVPLQHYLYTGCGGGSRDNRFLVLQSNGTFDMKGYNNAVQSFNKLKDKKQGKDNYKPQTKVGNMRGPYSRKTEKIMWDGLIAHLEKHQLLPVVVFTFSRKRCDENAQNLSNLDLTTESEKFHIHLFFEKCIKSLKPPDRELPQIINMRYILSKGIGVHHSGILPIIKEMIEMLFQKQYVKILFATETFAMGVNMPARTVVFDSICKHDGHQLRNLHPAEYIQMAGRAGRRGLDETGTVIILCKGIVRPLTELQDMMLGKPSKLKSQFRITYGMVLTLLRVESLSVEGMISRSFREADHQKRMCDNREQLDKVEKKISDECAAELSEYMMPLIKFYNSANSYLIAREDVWIDIIKSPQVWKELSPGRVLLITHKSHINKLALVLQTSWKLNEMKLQVLVLSNKLDAAAASEKKDDLWYKMLALSSDQIFVPAGTATHEVLTIMALDIFEITSKVIKINAELIIKDWEKRQIARFSNDAPGPSCTAAIQELMNVTLNTADKNNSHHRALYLDLIGDLKINTLDLCEHISYLHNLKDILVDYISGTQVPNFQEQFAVVFEKQMLEDRKANLQYQLSYASMSLYPEYQKRINLLKELNYVNSQNRVELKGKVACEIGMRELLITELVLRNILADLQPAEVAALLSALVFQAKTECKLELSPELEKGKLAIEDVHNTIRSLENQHGLNQIGEQELNFGLVEVVYEWANAKPFSNIMQLTDVQEGIIVRCIQQLNETICDVRSVARLTGDPKLHSKMEEASTAIKRDIVFAGSLYTQHENL